MTIGLITGSGLERFGFDACEALTVTNAYGPVELQRARAGEREVILLQRHGAGHTIPPHRINYRANLRALRDLGCGVVLATNAVGSLRPTMQPGDCVIPDQFIDCTKLRPTTFFDGEDGVVRHVDVTAPYCPHLRQQIAQTADQHGLVVHAAGTYLCTEGPRFETPAEIRAYATWGADLVGMTGVPEVVLARELGMCYAGLCLVTNFAAGTGSGPITSEEIEEIADLRRAALDGALRDLLLHLTDEPGCACHQWW